MHSVVPEPASTVGDLLTMSAQQRGKGEWNELMTNPLVFGKYLYQPDMRPLLTCLMNFYLRNEWYM